MDDGLNPDNTDVAVYALVRNRGAIGRYYWTSFLVTVRPGENCKEAFWRQYGDKWDVNAVNGTTKPPTSGPVLKCADVYPEKGNPLCPPPKGS